MEIPQNSYFDYTKFTHPGGLHFGVIIFYERPSRNFTAELFAQHRFNNVECIILGAHKTYSVTVIRGWQQLHFRCNFVSLQDETGMCNPGGISRANVKCGILLNCLASFASFANGLFLLKIHIGYVPSRKFKKFLGEILFK